jgi:hypothetical protein
MHLRKVEAAAIVLHSAMIAVDAAVAEAAVAAEAADAVDLVAVVVDTAVTEAMAVDGTNPAPDFDSILED